MSRLPLPPTARRPEYPTTDGKPMAETDLHRDLMVALIETLKAFYLDDPSVYISGNLLLYYEEGNRRKRLAPDVFLVRGVAKHRRENYLLWEEGHSPRFVIELTSSSTRREDTNKKKALYRDVLKVREYFLFDPNEDYLTPSMQGWRLVKGVYQSIRAVDGRLPSQTTGLHLERDGNELRLWNPETREWLLVPVEEEHRLRLLAEEQAEQADERAERAEAELRRLRQQFGVSAEPI